MSEKKYIAHSENVRNNQSNIPQNPGMNWAGPGVNAIDTMKVKNSTFFVFGGNVVGSGSSIGYLEFDHNTIFMQTKDSPFHLRQMHNAKITNNIFYSVYSAGLDSSSIYDAGIWSANWYCKPAIIQLDSLYEQLEGDPYFLTEADRNIIATNNNYFWPQAIVDNFDIMNADEKYQIVGGKIYAPVWAATRPGAEAILTDRDSWPGIDVYTNNDSLDPGFLPDLVQAASDSMTRFVRHLWENGGDGEGSRPFVYLSNPQNMFAGVPEDWALWQSYPVRENLRYTNTVLLTAGTDGLPLGDLNWFSWKTPLKVDENSNTPPVRFSLSQNYPNPFNPETVIKYQLSITSKVTITVYDILGGHVATLVSGNKPAGNHSVTFNASNLASGIYFYRLRAGAYFASKKMILLR